MIGSFWNLCRACPSMPVDKLHSEYRSTYRWHEYTGPRHDVIRRPPQVAQTAEPAVQGSIKENVEEPVETQAVQSNYEPAMSRKKKHPSQAYRTNEFIPTTNCGGSEEMPEVTVKGDRARSEERVEARNQPSRRSKSEGPPDASAATAQSGSLLHIVKALSPPGRSESEPSEEDMTNPIATVLSRISTEYQLQFAWPRGDQGTTKSENYQDSTFPRKSVSMSVLRPTSNPNLVALQKKRVADADIGEDEMSELEPLVSHDNVDGHTSFKCDDSLGEEKIQEEMSSKEEKTRRRKEFRTEYKEKYRPFSQYSHGEGMSHKKTGATDTRYMSLALPAISTCNSWFKEVIELRKKATKYKHRGWGTELVPQHIAELYKKQMRLWEQVSGRSSLSTLSLATTSTRSISKEEKNKENSKKTSPTAPSTSRQQTARPPNTIDTMQDTDKHVVPVSVPEGLSLDKQEVVKSDIFRSRKDFLIRHHLQRTTGAEEGVLLTSPTREKLEPVLPRHKEDDIPRSPKRGSPKNSPTSKNRSPKRQSRLSSAPTTAITATHHPAAAQQNGGVQPERRPRPTFLATNAPSCLKSSSDPAPLSQHSYTKPTSSRAKLQNGVHGDHSKLTSGNKQDATEEVSDKDKADQTLATKTNESKEEAEDIVVKSPPEPTRVKSPEQIILRSPEPVNWTVPLDTGKTFTVTQNIHNGELMSRPHSEVKAWTPPAARPPAPQSAPPELLRQHPEQRTAVESGASSPNDATDSSFQSPSHGDLKRPGGNSLSQTGSHETAHTHLPGHVQNEADISGYVEGTTLRCLDAPDDLTMLYHMDKLLSKHPESSDPGGQPLYRVLEATPQPATTSPEPTPSQNMPITSPATSRSLASDVLEKARNRFDKFWGKGKDPGEKQGKV